MSCFPWGGGAGSLSSSVCAVGRPYHLKVQLMLKSLNRVFIKIEVLDFVFPEQII